MSAVRRVAIVQPDTGADASRLVVYLIEGARRAGLDARAFASSDDLEDFDPDAVFALSPSIAKVTRHPTYGLLTGSWLEYQAPRLLRNVLGYDAYLTASGAVRQWLEDISFGARKRSPIGFFAPSAPFVSPAGDAHRTGLATFVDGETGGEAAACLTGRDDVIRVGGGAQASAGVRVEQVRADLARCVAGLWIDDPGRAAHGQPALPIFEMAAAGVLPITNRNPFVEQWFGDAVLYVDAEAPPRVIAWQVDRHMAWIGKNPSDAAARAAMVHDVFSSRLALEVLFRGFLELHIRVLAEKGYACSPTPDTNARSIVYVVNTQGDPERVLQSLRAQQYPALRTVLVSSSPARDVSATAAKFPDLSPTVLPPVAGAASSPVWAGLHAVRESGADLFGILDDRDELFPNHVETLLRTLDTMDGRSWFGSFGLAYSGAAERAIGTFARDRLSKASEDPDPRRTRVRHYRFFHPGYLDDGAHQVHPGAFLARTSLLDDEVLTDPELRERPEAYLQLLLAEKTLFAFSCEMTMVTHDRDDEPEADAHVAPLTDDARRTFFRTYGRQFPAASVYLHNVIFMTAFDKDLLAPILVPAASHDRDPATPLTFEPAGSAVKHDGVVRLDERLDAGARASVTRLRSGRHHVRLYFATARAAAATPPSIQLVSEETSETTGAVVMSVEPIGHAWRADYELDVTPEQAVRPASLHVRATSGERLELLGGRVDRLAQVLSRSVLDLPADRPLWLYGAGQGGRQAKRKLELAGLQVAGFIDKVKTGTLEGVPIVDLPTAQAQLGPDATVIIASMFWEEIRKDIEATGVTASLYSFYPFTGDVVYALN